MSDTKIINIPLSHDITLLVMQYTKFEDEKEKWRLNSQTNNTFEFM